MAQDFAKAFYRSKAWEQCRAAYARSVGWLCEDCLERGQYTPGKIVHHLESLTPENIGKPEISLGWNNLRMVCQDCHAKRHRVESGNRYCFDGDGALHPPPQGAGNSGPRGTGEGTNILP